MKHVFEQFDYFHRIIRGDIYGKFSNLGKQCNPVNMEIHHHINDKSGQFKQLCTVEIEYDKNFSVSDSFKKKLYDSLPSQISSVEKGINISDDQADSMS